MTLRKTAAVLGITLVVMTGTSLGAATPEETFRKNFPNIRLDGITPTPRPKSVISSAPLTGPGPTRRRWPGNWTI